MEAKLHLPIDVKVNPINFMNLVNRDTLQMRNNEVYAELHANFKEILEAYDSKKYTVAVELTELFLMKILICIQGMKGDPYRLAEWGLQVYVLDEYLEKFPLKKKV